MKKYILIICLISVVFLSSCKPSLEKGEQYLSKGKYDKAIKVFKNVIDDDEYNYDAWFGIVEAQILQEDYDEASDTLEDIFNIILDDFGHVNPIDDSTYFNLIRKLKSNCGQIEDEVTLGDWYYDEVITSVLDKGEYHFILHPDKQTEIQFYLNTDEIKNQFGIILSNDLTDATIQFNDYFESLLSSTYETLYFDRLKDCIYASFLINDGSDIGIYKNLTLKQYADETYGLYIDEMLNYKTFYNMDNETLNAGQLLDYSGCFVVEAYNYGKGTYFTLPGEVLLVSDLEFKRINDNTIYITGGYGVIVYR